MIQWKGSDRKRSQYIWGSLLWPLSGGDETNQEKRNDFICLTIVSKPAPQ